MEVTFLGMTDAEIDALFPPQTRQVFSSVKTRKVESVDELASQISGDHANIVIYRINAAERDKVNAVLGSRIGRIGFGKVSHNQLSIEYDPSKVDRDYTAMLEQALMSGDQ